MNEYRKKSIAIISHIKHQYIRVLTVSHIAWLPDAHSFKMEHPRKRHRTGSVIQTTWRWWTQSSHIEVHKIRKFLERSSKANKNAKPSLRIFKKRGSKTLIYKRFWTSFLYLSYWPFHFIRNKSVQLDCILHRKFFGEWLDEAHDDHFGRLGFDEATAHQVV